MRFRSCRGPITNWSKPLARIVITNGVRLDAKAHRPRWYSVARYDWSRLRPRGCGPSRPGRLPLRTSTPGKPSAMNWQHDASIARSVVAFGATRPPILPNLRLTYLSSVCHRSFFAPLREQVQIPQKAVRYRPADKLLDA